MSMIPLKGARNESNVLSNTVDSKESATRNWKRRATKDSPKDMDM